MGGPQFWAPLAFPAEAAEVSRGGSQVWAHPLAKSHHLLLSPVLCKLEAEVDQPPSRSGDPPGTNWDPPYTVPGMNTCVQVHACSFDLLLHVFARPELPQVSQEHVLLLLYHSSPLAWLTGGFSFLLLWSLKTKGLGFLQAQDVFGLVCCLFFFFFLIRIVLAR